MGIFVRESRAQRVAQFSPSTLGDRSGRSTAGQAVTFDTALSIGSVWAACVLRADIISTLPLDVYRRRPGSAPEPVSTPPVLLNPSGNGVTMAEWLFSSQLSLDLRGNAYGLVVDRDGRGLPAQIELQHPDRVVPRIRPDGSVWYRVSGKWHPSADVWHERQNTLPGSLVGMSPIAVAMTAHGVPLAAESFGADWFEDGAHPSGVLQNTTYERLPDGVGTAMKELFRKATQGNREPIVVGSSWKYTPLQVSPNESQFIETMQWGVQQIARLYRVPPSMIGGASGDNQTYANQEQKAQDFLTFHTAPTLVRREHALSALTPSPQYVKLNAGALLRTELKARYAAYGEAIKAGWYTRDEVREKEDLPPLTDQQKADIVATLGLLPGNTAKPPNEAQQPQEGQ